MRNIKTNDEMWYVEQNELNYMRNIETSGRGRGIDKRTKYTIKSVNNTITVHYIGAVMIHEGNCIGNGYLVFL